jgi:hypothetical protein
MSFIDRFIDWYRGRAALATGDIRKYVVAEKRVGLALALTVVAIGKRMRFPLL